MLRAGSNNPPDAFTNRTNATPFSVAARVDVPGSPPNPILPPLVAGPYTIGGMGFVAGATQVLLETVPLTSVPVGPPLAGQFTVESATRITFMRPTNLPSGRYGVRVRVNAVESPPALWIQF
jgi:hypothetical protein